MTTVMTAKQHVFPPPLTGRYDVVDGRVQTRSLEAHVVDHCNLRCAECCSLSPLLPSWSIDVDAMARDLRRARRVLQPRVFKLVGGEPTLHPHLVELVRAVRHADIAPRISVTTNGLLLPKLADDFFAAVDALTLSLYPEPALSRDAIAAIEERAARFNVALNWKQQDVFVRMNRPALLTDDDENQRVWDTCWLRERCHMIKDGVFFTCTRPPHFHTLDAVPLAGDGLVLDDDTGADDVLAYLLRKQPLATCARCFGGNAATGPHRQLSKDDVVVERQKLRVLSG